jgi:hypothetical protein
MDGRCADRQQADFSLVSNGLLDFWNIGYLSEGQAGLT